MSDRTPIDDELVSAYLDDEVTATERALVEADADSMARVADLRFVRDAVAAPVTRLDEDDRGRLLALALAASETSPTVTSMTVARARRTWSRRPLVAVAAAVAVIGLAVPVIRNLDLGGDAGDTAAPTVEAAAADPADEPAAARSEDDAADGGDALEAAPMASDAAGAVGDADMADEPAEEAAEAAAASDVAETQSADSAVDIAFDPLLPELGNFASIDLVVDRVFADYAGWLEDPEVANALGAGVDAPDDARCLDDLDLRERLEVQMSDRATAAIDNVDHLVWLLDDGTVYVTPFEDCSPVVVSNYFEG